MEYNEFIGSIEFISLQMIKYGTCLVWYVVISQIFMYGDCQNCHYVVLYVLNYLCYCCEVYILSTLFNPHVLSLRFHRIIIDIIYLCE